VQLANIYKELRDAYTGQEMKVKLSDIASALSCSNRNANFIVRKLHEKKWIEWVPGRGRGNVSTLKFLVTIEEMYMEIAKETARKGNLNHAIGILDEHVADVKLRNHFFSWISTVFGYQQMKDANKHTLSLPINHLATLHPMYTACGVETHIARYVFDTLVRYNKTFEGKIAHYWENNDSFTEWTFFLRKGIYFHDGSELKASDVLFTFGLIKESPYRWMAKDIASMEIVHDWCLTFKLSSPNRFFLSFLSAHPLSILPEKAYHDGFGQAPIGTGPYKLEKGPSLLVLEANERYFLGRPFIDRINLWPLDREGNERPDLFQVGYLRDLGSNETKGIKTVTKEEIGCKLLTFNLNLPGVQQNQWFREAIAHCIKKEELIAGNDGFVVASRLLPGHDLKLEEVYVSLADYKGEVVNLYTSPYHQADALVIQKQCEKIGVNLKVRLIEKKGNEPYPKLEDAHIILYESLYEDDLVFTFLETFMTGDSYIRRHLNPSSLKEIELLIFDQIRSESDPVKLLDVLFTIELKLINEFSLIPLYRRIHTLQHPDTLKGVTIGALGWVDFNSIWY
jgi:SgrR family transcriptional regulator